MPQSPITLRALAPGDLGWGTAHRRECIAFARAKFQPEGNCWIKNALGAPCGAVDQQLPDPPPATSTRGGDLCW